MDNGARRALIPIENKRHFLEVSADIVERVDPVFYSDPLTAARKALGLKDHGSSYLKHLLALWIGDAKSSSTKVRATRIGLSPPPF